MTVAVAQQQTGQNQYKEGKSRNSWRKPENGISGHLLRQRLAVVHE